MPSDARFLTTEAEIGGILSFLDSVLGGSSYFAFIVLGVGIFLSVYLRFPQVRFFGHAVSLLSGRYTRRKAPGEATHAQALAIALAGTIGAGNITGVAITIHIGGPAAIVWMWVAAFFGMALQYGEVTLSHAYRRKHSGNNYLGGPMLYMEEGLGKRWMGWTFAAALGIASLGVGAFTNHFMGVALQSGFEVPPLVTGLLALPLLVLIIMGGAQRIAVFAAAILPIMLFTYVLEACLVSLTNYQQILPSLALIFRDAFSPAAATGGFLGGSFVIVIQRAVSWTLASNEAGQGSSPHAHSLARTDEPVAQGAVSFLGPFLDTFVLSTLGGLALLTSGAWDEKFLQRLTPSELTVLVGTYTESSDNDTKALSRFITDPDDKDGSVELYTGSLKFSQGALTSSDVTLLANRSIVDELQASSEDEGSSGFSGSLEVENGRIESTDVSLSGQALANNLQLVFMAAQRGALPGSYGPLLVLAMFSFSTAVIWCYYGTRLFYYLFGQKAVVPFRILYSITYFLALLVNTSILWKLASVTAAIALIPNLVALVLMRKELKERTDDYSERLARGRKLAS